MTYQKSGASSSKEADFTALIYRIRDRDSTAVEELTGLFSPGIRFLLSRQLESMDVERELQSTLSAVIRAIEGGELCESAGLASFVREIVRGQPNPDEQARRLRKYVTAVTTTSECSSTPEPSKEILEQVAKKLSPTELEVLRGYYIEGKTPESIQSKLNLTATQFQLITLSIKSPFRSLKLTRSHVSAYYKVPAWRGMSRAFSSRKNDNL